MINIKAHITKGKKLNRNFSTKKCQLHCWWYSLFYDESQ